MIEWNKSYTFKLYGCEVDPQTWQDKGTFNIESGTISKSDSDLREGADITTVDFHTDAEMWVRVYMDVRQKSISEHVPLFTGLATSPSFELDGGVKTTKMECYSVLKALDDILLPRGWYASPYRNTQKILQELLEPTPAPIDYEDDLPRLTDFMIAEDGESNLSMLNTMLNNLRLVMTIAGDGRITIRTSAKNIQATFGEDFDIIEPQVSVKNDWYSCPNVFMAIADEVMAIAKDNDDDSPLSIGNRGREIWQVEDGVDLPNNMTLAEYAKARLKEEQSQVETLSYKRLFLPDVYVGDAVRIHYNEVTGVYRIVSQKMDMDGSVSEEVAKI